MDSVNFFAFLLGIVLILLNLSAKTKQDITDNEVLDCDTRPNSCADHYQAGNKTSGEYIIYVDVNSTTTNVANASATASGSGLPSTRKIKVFCDMTSKGGAWMVVLRRGKFPTPVKFDRSFATYSKGFGNLSTEYWLGNDIIHAITAREKFVLRVAFRLQSSDYKSAYYDEFFMASGDENYKLKVGKYKGNAGDGLLPHQGAIFVTKDRNMDAETCTESRNGGWWHSTKGCDRSNLNGVYETGDTKAPGAINWFGLPGPILCAEMKMRPKNFDPDKSIRLCKPAIQPVSSDSTKS